MDVSLCPGVGDGQGSLACCSPWCRRIEHNWATELTELKAPSHWRCDDGVDPLDFNQQKLGHCWPCPNSMLNSPLLKSPPEYAHAVQVPSWIGICVCVYTRMPMCALSHFSRVWLPDPMDCSPPGSSTHGILQARILEWVAVPNFRKSSRPRDRTRVSCIGKQILYHSRHLGRGMCP